LKYFRIYFLVLMTAAAGFCAGLEIVNQTLSKQGMEVTFQVVVKYLGRIKTDASVKLNFDYKTFPLSVKGKTYRAGVYATRLAPHQPYTIMAEYKGKYLNVTSTLDVDATQLAIQYEADIDSASCIAIRDLDRAKTVKCGCLTVQPQAIGGNYDGVWLTDSGECYEALRYWADNDYVRDYLYMNSAEKKGLVEFFAQYQETEGEYAGNLAEAIYGDAKHHWDKDRTIDYGGAFDLAVSPRKNHRDLGNAVYIFCNYWYWKDFDDAGYIVQYYDVMKNFLLYHLSRQDKKTGLIKSTYLIDHCDVCIDQATPASCAVFTVNALLCLSMEQFGEMAAAIDHESDARYFLKTAAELRNAINAHLWNEKNHRYEIKIFHNVTANALSPAFGITEDHYFFPASHGRFLDDWGNHGWLIPDSPDKIAKIIDAIEEAQLGIKIYSPMVFPAYPDGWHNKMLNGGRYCNGDCWTQFGSRYLGALFHLGYPEIAYQGLKNLAQTAMRDDCFYEYYENDQEGAGKGVANNNWANAAYLHALVKGLFGLQADYPNQILYIHPCLSHSGQIQCRLGKHAVDMTLDMNQAAGKTNLIIKTSYSGPADFRLWIDDAASACVIIKNKKKVAGKLLKLGAGSFVVFRENLQPGENSFTLLVKKRNP
jgi:hypothetical protein